MATELMVVGNYPAASSGSWGRIEDRPSSSAGYGSFPLEEYSIGMLLFPIDLIFLSKDKRVVHLEEYFRPFRVSRVSLKTASVLELPTHTIYRSGTKVGDVVEISVNR